LLFSQCQKKFSFIQIIFSFFTIVLIVSSIFIFLIFYNQEKQKNEEITISNLNKYENYIKHHLDLSYKFIYFASFDKYKHMQDLKDILIKELQTNNLFTLDGVLIKNNSKIIFIKGDNKKLFATPISDKIQKIGINGDIYYVKHFLVKNYNFDVVLYYNMNKLNKTIFSKISNRFKFIILFIIVVLLILNLLYEKLLIKPTNKLIDTMKLIVQEKKF
jgi:hypothetical protein